MKKRAHAAGDSFVIGMRRIARQGAINCKEKIVERRDDVVAGRHYFDPFLVCKSYANDLFAE